MITQNQDKEIDIENFFKMSVGNWLTQKTSYNPNSKKHKTKTTKTTVSKIEMKNLLIHFLEKITDQNPIEKNSGQAYNITSKQDNKDVSSIITYSYQNHSKSNGVIHKIDNNNLDKTITGKFHLCEGVLKILVNKETLSVEETIWFINENLKLTKSITRKNEHCVLISFISEIKIRSDEDKTISQEAS
nr:Ycf58 [Erythrotrichia foliiformis]